MVGAFVGWTIAVGVGVNYLVAILAGGLIAMVIGIVLERLFLRYLHAEVNAQALLTIGAIMVLVNLSQWIWGPEARPAFRPPSLSGTVSMLGVKYPLSRIVIIVVALGTALVLWLVDRRTRLGARIRAGRDDKEMLLALGVDFNRLGALVFGAGALLAGIAGVIGAPLFGANLDLAWTILLFAVIVIVVGGLGSVAGSLIGAMLIGSIYTAGSAVVPDFADFLAYGSMIVILVVMPRGLVGGRV